MEAISGVHIAPITAEETYQVRHEVLWPHEPFESVRLATDAASFHLGAFSDGQSNGQSNGQSKSTKRSPIGVISICVSNPDDKAAQAKPSNGKVEAQFRKMAVAPEWRGRGIGSKLWEQATVVASDAGADEIWCDARIGAVPFYQKFGLHVEGSSFMRKEVEYVMMRRALS